MSAPILRKQGAFPDLPDPRTDHSMCASDSAIYVVGGNAYNGANTSLLRMAMPAQFAPASLAWERLADAPRARSYGAGCILTDDKIYLLGGADGYSSSGAMGGEPVAWVDVYDITSNVWTALPDMPYGVTVGTTVLLGRTIHVVGGSAVIDGASTTGTHISLNLDTHVWSSPQLASAGGAGASINGKLYALAGEGGDQVYDPATGAWTGIAPFPGPRNGGTAVVVGSNIVLFGQGRAAPVWIYDTSANAWTQPSNVGLLVAGPSGVAATCVLYQNAVLAVVSGGMNTIDSHNPWSAKVEFFGFQVTPDAAPNVTAVPDTDEVHSSTVNTVNTVSRPQFGAVFGTDSRIESTAITDPARENLSQAACGLFESARVNTGASTYEVAPASTLNRQLAANFPGNTVSSAIPFLSQPVAAFGSGTLIAPNLILTCAHNFYNADQSVKRDPTTVWIVFGWTLANGNEIPPARAFKGKRVVRYSYEDLGDSGSTDWAIVELGRADDPSVSASTTLPTTPLVDVDPAVQTPLWMVGHPSGLPLKYVDGAKVLTNEAYSCATNLDSFAGNSGSGVLDSQNRLVGVFMSGPRADYVVSGNQVVVGTYTADTSPANFSKSKPIFDLSNASAFFIRFAVGGDFWADSSDPLGFAVDAEPQVSIESPFFGWARNSSYQCSAEHADALMFPSVVQIKKFTKTVFTDDLQLTLVELWSGTRLIQRWTMNKWMGRSEVYTLSIDVRAKLFRSN